MGDVQRNDSIALINGVIYPMSSPGRAKALFAKNGIIEAIGATKIYCRCVTVRLLSWT